MIEHAVVISGAGPTGLMLAGELALAGVDVAIVERRESQEVHGTRAGGLHSRTVELLDQRGIAERFVSRGQKHAVAPFPGALLDIGDLPTRHNYWLAIKQDEVERLLAEWTAEMAVPVYYGSEVLSFAQDATGVVVGLADGRKIAAEYLVGCDGGRSLVRKLAKIDFPGWDADISYLIFEAKMADDPPWGTRHGQKGIYALGKLEDGNRVRGVITEPTLRTESDPTVAELRAALRAAYGADYGVEDITWISRFTDAARQAAAYRKGRVILAGDAAHVHSPAGGQGLNIGLQDAVNLGWKLARVVGGISPEELLDSYHAERHPAAARILRSTLAITALNRGDARTAALREFLSDVMTMDQPRRRYGAMMSGLDIRYDLGDGHPLLGRRIPDFDLTIEGEPQRVFTFLHEGRHVLLNFGEPNRFNNASWADRVRQVDASCDGPWELPVVGAVSAPTAVLIRPDGHVAWVDNQSERDPAELLSVRMADEG